ncbi:MAG TPA: DUF2961 domain-containing protein, partial [Clostridia bacterium]|nr:DUF2961 domain-containing protein [Clostridia bacterium]
MARHKSFFQVCGHHLFTFASSMNHGTNPGKSPFPATRRALCGVALLALVAPLLAAEPPEIPVGLDAYLQWDRWAHQRIGARAYMRSTYDRTGGNESADASHFLYQASNTFNVTLDVEGPGILYFARYNHWHGSPWHYEVDGVDHIVQESSTADPLNPVANSVFMPETLFPNPLTWTWSLTKGADLMWVPIPFEQSFRMAYSRTRYGTGYYIYHQYVPGAKLSQPIRAWDGNNPPHRNVLALLDRAGTDIAPQLRSPESWALKVAEQNGSLTVPEKGSTPLTTLTRAPAMIRALQFSVPRQHALEFGRARIRITWDKRREPSVDAPVALFFGTGTFYNRDDREYLVKAFPMNVRYEGDHLQLACYFPMPFFRHARIELVGCGKEIPGVNWSLRYHPLTDPPNHVGYFHATFRDHPQPELGKDLVLLDTRNTEGGGDWSGSFIGTSFIFTHRNNLSTLEGDPRFFFDDSLTPQAYGTGTEEWGGGGDYWGGRNMTLPFAGHPVGARNAQEAKEDEDKIHSAYRFLLADLMPFGKNALIRFDHGGINQSTEHYKTVAYWYGIPAPSLIKTDELKVGDPASERAHNYISPEASDPYAITSRYEWGVDTYYRGYERPKTDPRDFAEFEFEADAGKAYYIWVRGRSADNNIKRDSFWIQFNEEIGTEKLGCNNEKLGFGNWLDRVPARTYAWASALPSGKPQTITFAKGGKQTLRLQPRHPGHFLEQIWLSTSQDELPPLDAPGPATPRHHSEIILSPSNVTRVQGHVKTKADPLARSGTALWIDGAGEDVIYPDPFRSRNQPDPLEAPGASQVVAYPPHQDIGRKTTTGSEFTLRIKPDNHGVMLRRKLDYAFPNQRAEVFIADGSKKPQDRDWKPAGIWYLAGGNTYIYS